jgi:hypothetical protein
VNLAREYMHQRSGYRFGTGCFWVRIYKGEPGDSGHLQSFEGNRVRR